MSETDILPVRVQNVLDMEIVRLNLWSIKFNASNIKLEGFVRNEEGTMMQKVCSEVICKRMNATMLFDVSGRFYELSGQIDREFQLKNGMPGRIVDEFLAGFPENWAFLISQCLTNEQRSVLRPIQAAPTVPLRAREPQKEPIVTLAEESDMEKREIEKRKKKEEEEAANNTFRAPKSFGNDAITPIRFTRPNNGASRIPVAQRVFEQTPVRASTVSTTTNRPLASSTPQLPKKAAEPAVAPPAQFASDADLFAVPKLPRNTQKPTGVLPLKSSSSSSGLDILDEMDVLFDNATIDKTPSRIPRNSSVMVRRPTSPGEFRRSRQNSRIYEYEETRRRGGRINEDESRMARKRGYERSPDRRDDYSRRRDDYDDYRGHRDDERRYSSVRYDSKRYRPRETSSSSGRSVRFEENHRRRHRRDSEDEERELREQEERKKLKELMRREKEIEERLEQKKKEKKRRYTYSSDSADETMGDEWDRENQEILDNSVIMERGGGGSYKRNRAKSVPVKIKKEQQPPKRKAPQAKKQKNVRDPLETEDLNESIASNRPRRACATPAVTPAPKRITWPRRELDKLKRVIELKKPTENPADWAEVARLLAKDGVEPSDVKTVAETRLKWKPPTVDPIQVEKEEEEEKKRRKGAAAKVRENVEMREEMRNGGEREDELRNRVEQMEEYQPADLSADESLLAFATPEAVKRRGGTRKSVLPAPVEDSPIVRGNDSSIMNSPRLDSTKAKEVETTLKYVQQLTSRGGGNNSSMNKTQLNISRNYGNSRGGGGSRNTSMTLEQGAKKAIRMVNRAMDIHEEEEEDEEGDDEEEEEDY